jgi:hypothetical protein
VSSIRCFQCHSGAGTIEQRPAATGTEEPHQKPRGHYDRGGRSDLDTKSSSRPWRQQGDRREPQLRNWWIDRWHARPIDQWRLPVWEEHRIAKRDKGRIGRHELVGVDAG